MPTLPASEIVTVNVTKQNAIKSLEDFGALCVFTEDATIAQGEYREYTSVEAFDADFDTPSSIKTYGDTFFAQNPVPTKLYVARVDTASGDFWPSTIEARAQEIDFYAVGLDTLDLEQQTMLNVALMVESLEKLWVQARRYSDALTIYQALQTENMTRTAIIMKDQDTDDNRLDAAWLGFGLTRQAGAINWSNNTLTGVTPTSESISNIQALLNAGVNVYANVATTEVTLKGTTAATNPTYIDQIQAMDYIKINITTDIMDLLLSQDKVPYTDGGMKALEAVCLNVLRNAQALDILDPTVRPTATAPSVTTVDATQRAARIAPTITCTARLSGAINDVVINVNVEI